MISRKPKPPKRRQLWLSVFLVVLPILVIITCIYVQAINKDKYLVIREWGVRFELPKELRGKITYAMGTNDASGTGPYFSTSDFTYKSDGKTYPQALGISLRRVSLDDDPSTYLPDSYVKNKLGILGEYQYYYNQRGSAFEDRQQDCMQYRKELNAADHCRQIQSESELVIRFLRTIELVPDSK